MTHTRSEHQVLVPFAAVVLAMLPAVLDQTMLATGLPVIAGDLGRISDVSWVVTAYVVAAAAVTPLWGKLGDRLGRKRMLELSLVVFVAASALCGAAQDITQLIALRLVQGTAAGGLMALAMASVGDLVSPRERGRYQGYIAATFAVATIVGPLLGGALVEGASWRWVFFVNLPVGLVALIGLRLRLPAPAVEPPGHPLDGLGAALLAAATSTLMLACIQDGGRPALIAATVVLSAALVVQERRAADPIVPLRLLRTRTVAIVSTALFLAIAALFSVTVFVPLFLQTVTGATPTEAGLLLVPAMLGITVSTTAGGSHHLPHRPLQALPGRRPGADDGRAGGARHRRGRSVTARHRHRAGRLRPRLRDGHAGARDGGPELRRAPRARRGDRDRRLLPRPRRRRRRRRARRRVRRPHRRRRGPRGCDRRRADRVRRGGGAGRAGADRRAGARRGAAEDRRRAAEQGPQAAHGGDVGERGLVMVAALYDWLLLGHIIAAMVWLGGGVVLAVLAVATLRSGDGPAVARFVAGLRVIGPAVLAPATIATLGVGIWLVLDSAAWDFGQAWVLLALALFAAAVVVGAGHQGRAAINAQRAIDRDDHAEARRQLARWTWGYGVVVSLLLVIAWDMVFKPGL